jgi:hypothetical protein
VQGIITSVIVASTFLFLLSSIINL